MPASLNPELVGYGYRVGEVEMPPIGDIKDSVKFSKLKPSEPNLRPPTSVTLGCHVVGQSLPHVDPSDPITTAAGVCKRFATKTPEVDPALLARLRVFVRKYVRKNFAPLEATSDTSVEYWLRNSNYPEWRKKELLDCYNSHSGPLLDSETHCSSFPKDEEYAEYKHTRGINSRSDYFKTLVGPIFVLIEK